MITESRKWSGTTIRNIVGVLFLVLQLFMIVRARFVPERYFCWAPHDSQNEYKIDVMVDGQLLAPAAVEARYRLARQGVDPRAIAHVFDVIRHREREAEERAIVEVRYRTNGRPEAIWIWQEQ
ncbi:MAG TPA: hypothetical protein VF701_20205 [Thermoanaerobaculia bacterium]